MNLYLSKSTYALNSSIVGTITFNSNNTSNSNDKKNNTSNDTTSTLSSSYKSIKLYIAGRCRVDPRWHKSNTQESITKMYGSHPCHDVLPSFVEDYVVNSYFKHNKHNNNKDKNSNNASYTRHNVNNEKKNHSTTFCFWSTNVITLYYDGDGDDGDDGDGGDHDHDVTVPIYNAKKPFTNGKDKDTLQMDDSDWYKLGTKIASQQEITDEDFYEEEEEEIEGCKQHELNDLEYDYETDINDNGNEFRKQREVDQDDKNDNEETVPLISISTSASTLPSTTNYNHHNYHNTSTTTTTTSMNFTFKADLPNDLPPTINATSVRYFYSVVVVAEMKSNNANSATYNSDRDNKKYQNDYDLGNIQIIQAPFTVVMPKSIMMENLLYKQQNHFINNSNDILQKTQIRIGTIHAVAHSTLYPIELSSTYIADPWRTSVQRVNGGWDYSNVRSIMVEENGYSCALLTIVGGVIMTPGEKVLLHFEFLSEDEYYNHDHYGDTCFVKKDRLQCYMVSACLQGEENAIGMDGSKSRSRSYIFDTAYTHVDPDCTKSTSLNLLLPLDCPISLETDLVHIDISCRVDLTVRVPNSDSFKFLTVQFPCHVVNNVVNELEQDSDCQLSKNVLSRIRNCHQRGNDEDIENCNKVICPEVLDDLSMLSMHIMQQNRMKL